jgi:hypothetical protein
MHPEVLVVGGAFDAAPCAHDDALGHVDRELGQRPLQAHAKGATALAQHPQQLGGTELRQLDLERMVVLRRALDSLVLRTHRLHGEAEARHVRRALRVARQAFRGRQQHRRIPESRMLPECSHDLPAAAVEVRGFHQDRIGVQRLDAIERFRIEAQRNHLRSTSAQRLRQRVCAAGIRVDHRHPTPVEVRAAGGWRVCSRHHHQPRDRRIRGAPHHDRDASTTQVRDQRERRLVCTQPANGLAGPMRLRLATLRIRGRNCHAR